MKRPVTAGLVMILGVACLAGLVIWRGAPGAEDAMQRTADDSRPVEASAEASIGTGSRCVHDAALWWAGRPSVQRSPDGRAVIFTRSTDVFAATADGRQVRRVVDRAPIGREPPGRPIVPLSAISVSPSGTHLLYSICDESLEQGERSPKPPADPRQFDLVVRALAGGEPRRLTTHPGYDNFPSWSPDGTRIAFLSSRHVEGRPSIWDSRLAHLYTMAADGTAVRDLTPGFATVINQVPQWAPDGQRLAFVARGAEHRRTLYTVRADGTELRRIGLAASGPSWSPDGRRLAFAQPEGSAITLVTVGSTGEDARGIATIEGWQPTTTDPDPMWAWIDSVAWSPAGGQVLYTCGRRICVSATDGRLVGVSSRPVDGMVAAWSPDGTRIAVAAERRNLVREPSEPVLYDTAPDGRDVRILAVVGADRVLVAPGAQNSKVPAGDDICADGTLIREPRVFPELVGDCRVLLGLRDTPFGPRGARSNWSWGAELSEWVGVTIERFKPRVSAIHPGISWLGRNHTGGAWRPDRAAHVGLEPE